MLGLGSIGTALAFWLSVASALLCVGYGMWKWNDTGAPEGSAATVEPAHEEAHDTVLEPVALAEAAAN